jgi:hypothetical protein
MASGILLKPADAADIAPPATGKVTVFLDQATGEPAFKDDTGTVTPLRGSAGSNGSNGSNGAGYLATSTTSLATAGSGSKVFTTQAGLAYTAGARIRATSTGTSEWMEGVVTSYSSTTLTVTMDLNSGTGTHADWDINIAGQRGATGATGGAGGALKGARVSATGNQSISNGTFPALGFDAEVFDTDGFHDPVTNNTRLTVPAGEDGYYEVGGKVEWANNTSGARILGMSKNGGGATPYMQGGVPGSGASLIWTFNTGPIALVAGDYVEIHAYQDSGGSLNATNAREFWIKKLGT